MPRRVVVAILCATFVVASLTALWFVGSARGWGVATANAEEGTALVPPSLPEAQLPAMMEQAQSGGTAPTEAQIRKLWEPVQDAAAQGGWTPWALIVDADTGQVLFEASADTAHTPASTMKILTGFTALTHLDPQATLKTGVTQDGQTLYLWGEGDLTLAAGAGTPGAAYGRAGIADLADQVADAVGTGTFQLVYQPTLFGPERRAPAWAAQEVADYAGDVAPFAIDTGRTYPGAWNFVEDSAKSTADVLAAALRERGVTVDQVQAGAAPSSGEVVALVESAPLQDQIRYMLVHSDNTMAEQFCHMAAAEAGVEVPTFASSTSNVIATLGAAGIDTTGAQIYDCSGLDENSVVPPGVILGAMQASFTAEGSQGSLTRMLPVGGVSGTLAGRFETGAAYANLSAKTGSLGKASTMVGIGTTASGANLYVLVGTDNVPDNGAWETRPVADAFLTALFAL